MGRRGSKVSQIDDAYIKSFYYIKKTVLIYGLNLEKINVKEKSTLTVKTSVLRSLIQEYWFMPSYSGTFSNIIL